MKLLDMGGNITSAGVKWENVSVRKENWYRIENLPGNFRTPVPSWWDLWENMPDTLRGESVWGTLSISSFSVTHLAFPYLLPCPGDQNIWSEKSHMSRHWGSDLLPFVGNEESEAWWQWHIFLKLPTPFYNIKLKKNIKLNNKHYLSDFTVTSGSYDFPYRPQENKLNKTSMQSYIWF